MDENGVVTLIDFLILFSLTKDYVDGANLSGHIPGHATAKSIELSTTTPRPRTTALPRESFSRFADSKSFGQWRVPEKGISP